MSDPGEPAALIAWLVHTLPAARVLEIGIGDASRALQIAGALQAKGLLIAIERDPELARKAREAFTSAGYGHTVSVMPGDPSRYLHKVAGPFDLIVHDAALTPSAIHERLWELLRPAGVLVSHNLSGSADYNERLGADRRFRSTALAIGRGMALSLKLVETRDS